METLKAWFAREWAAIKKSGTIIFAWLMTASGAIVSGVVDLYNDPSVNDAIKSILKPEYIPWYVLGIGLLLRFVRMRNAKDL